MIKQEDYIYRNVTVHKTFEISIMLNLETNNEPNHSNIFGFQKEDFYFNQYGCRIPAVWLLPKSQEYKSAYSLATVRLRHFFTLKILNHRNSYR